MKSSETDILLVPGFTGSGVGHWQRRLAEKLATARIVEQQDWDHPVLAQWVAALVKAVKGADRPVVLVAHSLGVLLVAHAVPALQQAGVLARVKGAFLVSVPAPEKIRQEAAIDPAFAGPVAKLPFPALLIASSSDPYASPAEQTLLAQSLGAELVAAGDQGHINVASGHGPWPEGLMRFAGFLSKL
jgi:hypothetical protein